MNYVYRRSGRPSAFAGFALLFAGGCEAVAGLDDLHVRSANDYGDGAIIAQEGGSLSGLTDAQVLPPGDASSCAGSSCSSSPGTSDAGVGGSDAAQNQPGPAASDAGTSSDASGSPDARTSDASSLDANAADSAPLDANPGVADAAARDAAPSTPDTSVIMPMDLGKGDGSDVVLLGDSWMSNTLQSLGTGGGITPALLSVSKQPYRNYAVQGVMLLGDGVFGLAIPKQWDTAKSADADIKTVVMTGGGNDIIQGQQLQTDCPQGGSLCANKLKDIRAALGNLWAQMAASGVRDIVHVMYAKGSGVAIKDADAHNEALRVICNNVPAPARCHLFFTDAVVTQADLATDGSHPTATANTSIARALYDLMTKEGMRR